MDSDPTVFIVDDDSAVRKALTMSVESMDLPVEAYASAREFLDAYERPKRGCVLLDVRMPGISGLELLGWLVQAEIHPPVILISGYGDVPMVVQAMKLGALNFLEKPCRDQQLWEAVQEALKWDAENRKRFTRCVAVREQIARLSCGERDVMGGLVEGKSNRVIAEELNLSVRTIEVRRGKVMRKMRAESLAALVKMALTAKSPYEKPREVPNGPDLDADVD